MLRSLQMPDNHVMDQDQQKNSFQREDISPFLEVSFADPYGLPTLMPRWHDLEHSKKPRTLGLELSSEKVNSLRTLVVIHAFNTDKLPSLLFRLLESDFPSDIVITTASSEKAREIQNIRAEVMRSDRTLEIEVLPNHGRDVLPFWTTLQKYGPGYDYFLKLHLKRSAHIDPQGYSQRNDHDQDFGALWSNDIYSCLIPSSCEEHSMILNWMRDHGLSALYPRPLSELAHYGWADPMNMLIAASILRDLGVSDLNILAPLIYPVGNMFWGSMAAWLPFSRYFSEESRYPTEPLQTDGTFLHAVERCYSYLLTATWSGIGILYPPLPEDQCAIKRGVSLNMENHFVSRIGENGAIQSPACLFHSLYLEASCRQRTRANRLAHELDILRRRQPRFIIGTMIARLRASLAFLRT
jgi:rhamnosyltransferase